MKEISCNDSAIDMIAQVLEEMKTAAGSDFSPEKINLAELSRRTVYFGPQSHPSRSFKATVTRK